MRLQLLCGSLVFAVACSDQTPAGSDGCGSNAACAAGEACVTGACMRLCQNDVDCPSGFACDGDVCRVSSGGMAPEITGIDAEGTPELDPGKVAHRVVRHVVIYGRNLAGATVRIDGTNFNRDLEVCSGDDEQLRVALPDGLVSGASYSLSVATQAGTCSSTLPVLQGEQGIQGIPGNDGAEGSPGADGPRGPEGDANGGMALWLDLDESGGATAFVDGSPFKNNAGRSAGGVAPDSLGHTGRSVSFSGGALTVPQGNDVPNTPVVTVEAWIAPQLPMDQNRSIIRKEGAYRLQQENQGLAFYVIAAAGPCTVSAASSALLAPGVWAHVSGAYDGQSAVVKVNGIVRARTTCANGPIAATAGSPIDIGGTVAGVVITEPYLGLIDEIRVWHHANIAPPAAAQVVNVTTFVSSTRVVMPDAATITMESFTVDKKSPTSNLLIEGTISGWADASGSMTQGWRLGSGTEVTAQSLFYDEGDHSKLFPSSAWITGHTTTGPQTLVFRYFTANGGGGNKPFVTYNPNGTDDARLAQTRSVYRVWEIEPAL
jgi:hypothetical protein